MAAEQAGSAFYGGRDGQLCGLSRKQVYARIKQKLGGAGMAGYVLAGDQGTTSSRAIVFDGQYRVRGVAQQEFPQHFPRSGWVEHDPEDLWRTVVATMRGALADANL